MVDNDEEEYSRTSAERFIREYFDNPSRNTGLAVSREGAGIFQRDVLRDNFVVTMVKMSQGAVIFEGRSTHDTYGDLAASLANRLENSQFKEEVSYTLMINERFPSLEGGLQQAAIDSLLGSAPAVILYPKSWNATLLQVETDPIKKFWRSTLSSFSITSTIIYAVDSAHLLDQSSPAFQLGQLPDYFLPLVASSLSIQYASQVIEAGIAKSKNIRLSQVVLPAASNVFNFGHRSTILTPTANRNDMFDLAAGQIFVALALSIAAVFEGLQMTAGATQEAIALYPTLPVGLLKVNSIISSVLSTNLLPDLYKIADNADVHLHWLVVAGLCSFTANILQLIPVDNSAGSKLVYAALGQDSNTVTNTLFGVFKFLFFSLMLFNVGGFSSALVINKPRLLLDYLLISQLINSERETQIAVDNLSEVTESRKLLFFGFAFVLFVSFFPYATAVTTLSTSFDDSYAFLKNLVAK